MFPAGSWTLPRPMFGRRGVLRAAVLAGLAAADGRGARAADDQDAAFMQLSRLVTGRSDLDVDIGRRLREALVETHPNLPAEVSGCLAFARSLGLDSADRLAGAVDAQAPDFAGVLRTVLSAWYTGVAGDGPQARVIAYERALMFAVVGDVVAIPSYCPARPGFWTAKPPEI